MSSAEVRSAVPPRLGPLQGTEILHKQVPPDYAHLERLQGALQRVQAQRALRLTGGGHEVPASPRLELAVDTCGLEARDLEIIEELLSSGASSCPRSGTMR